MLSSSVRDKIQRLGAEEEPHEFVIKEEIKFVNISKVREQGPQFSSNFAHGQRHTRKKKLIFRSSMKFQFNASKINEFEDPYKELWQKLWTLRVLKFGTDCSAGIKWTQLSCSESILGE